MVDVLSLILYLTCVYVRRGSRSRYVKGRYINVVSTWSKARDAMTAIRYCPYPSQNNKKYLLKKVFRPLEELT